MRISFTFAMILSLSCASQASPSLEDRGSECLKIFPRVRLLPHYETLIRDYRRLLSPSPALPATPKRPWWSFSWRARADRGLERIESRLARNPLHADLHLAWANEMVRLLGRSQVEAKPAPIKQNTLQGFVATIAPGDSPHWLGQLASLLDRFPMPSALAIKSGFALTPGHWLSQGGSHWQIDPMVQIGQAAFPKPMMMMDRTAALEENMPLPIERLLFQLEQVTFRRNAPSLAWPWHEITVPAAYVPHSLRSLLANEKGYFTFAIQSVGESLFIALAGETAIRQGALNEEEYGAYTQYYFARAQAMIDIALPLYIEAYRRLAPSPLAPADKIGKPSYFREIMIGAASLKIPLVRMGSRVFYNTTEISRMVDWLQQYQVFFHTHRDSGEIIIPQDGEVAGLLP